MGSKRRIGKIETVTWEQAVDQHLFTPIPNFQGGICLKHDIPKLEPTEQIRYWYCPTCRDEYKGRSNKNKMQKYYESKEQEETVCDAEEEEPEDQENFEEEQSEEES